MTNRTETNLIDIYRQIRAACIAPLHEGGENIKIIVWIEI